MSKTNVLNIAVEKSREYASIAYVIANDDETDFNMVWEENMPKHSVNIICRVFCGEVAV
jgi:hypothetical protein